MLARTIAHERRLELLEQLALFGRQVHWRLDDDTAVKVARRAAAHRFHAAVAQAELPARLGLGRNTQFHFALERGNANDVAERRLRNPNRDVAMQIVAIALEYLVRTHA